mgnify:CR=1 FL=1
MDTATHFAMGIGLFGLAHLDPILSSQPETAQAILVGTVLGSQAPDFDGLSRIRGNSSYIRNHRGITHSLPMLLIWPILLTGGISLFFKDISILHLFFWTAIAVGIHIFIDLFNSYGTQVLRPFSERWIHWDILNIFDPVIFGLHLIGFILWWLTPFSPGPLFALIYLILCFYLLWRLWTHHYLRQWAQKKVGAVGTYHLFPTFHLNTWNLIVKEKERTRIGIIEKGTIQWKDELPHRYHNHPAVQSTINHPTIRSFLYFTDHEYVRVFPRHFGYEVRWIDVRFYYRDHFALMAVAWIDAHHRILDTHIGWTSPHKLEKISQSFSSPINH